MGNLINSNLNTPTVSVVVPLYNKGRYIERALASVLAQTHHPLEIIVVDDGSVDDGPEKVNSLLAESPHITLQKQENRGPGAARNAGLAIARGKYVSFLDADDEWLPTFLAEGVAMLEDEVSNATVVFTGYYYSPGMRRHTIGQTGELSGVYEIVGDTDFRLVRSIISFHWTCAAIMRTDIVRRWGCFFDQYKCLFGEDVYLFLKLIFNERIGIIPKPLAIYHTEASDLYGGGTVSKKIFPIDPFLEDPDEILASCPQSKLHILKKELAMRAIARAYSMAMLGKGREALKLLSRFTGNGYPFIEGTTRIRFFARVAPLLPTARWIWRKIKLVALFGRRQQ